MHSKHSFLLLNIWDKRWGISVIYQSYNTVVRNWPQYLWFDTCRALAEDRFGTKYKKTVVELQAHCTLHRHP